MRLKLAQHHLAVGREYVVSDEVFGPQFGDRNRLAIRQPMPRRDHEGQSVGVDYFGLQTLVTGATTGATLCSSIGAMQAQLDQTKKTYDMQKQLYDEKVISANEFNTADAAYKSALANFNAAKQAINASQAGVESAKAGLAKANKDISLATLVSPMDGVIDFTKCKKGRKGCWKFNDGRYRNDAYCRPESN